MFKANRSDKILAAIFIIFVLLFLALSFIANQEKRVTFSRAAYSTKTPTPNPTLPYSKCTVKDSCCSDGNWCIKVSGYKGLYCAGNSCGSPSPLPTLAFPRCHVKGSCCSNGSEVVECIKVSGYSGLYCAGNTCP